MWEELEDGCSPVFNHGNIPANRQQQIHTEELCELRQCKQKELENIKTKDSVKIQVRPQTFRWEPTSTMLVPILQTLEQELETSRNTVINMEGRIKQLQVGYESKVILKLPNLWKNQFHWDVLLQECTSSGFLSYCSRCLLLLVQLSSLVVEYETKMNGMLPMSVKQVRERPCSRAWTHTVHEFSHFLHDPASRHTSC